MSKPVYEITHRIAFGASPPTKALYPSAIEVLARAFDEGPLVVPGSRRFTIRVGGKLVEQMAKAAKGT
jgi:hypothetical protein